MMKAFARHGLAWTMIAVIPAAVNLLVWKIGVVPAAGKLADVRELAALADLKPRLEELVSQSDQMLARQSKAAPASGDIASTVQWIQGLAKTQGVKVEEINKMEPDGSAANLTPVEIKASGGYFKLVRWLGAMEKNTNIRMDQCFLGPASAAGTDDRMNLTLQVSSKNP